jgi:hypothetical protein
VVNLAVSIDVPVGSIKHALRTSPVEIRKDVSVLLLRSRHSYGKTQIWFPMDLTKVAAQLSSVGVSTTVVDLNIEPMPTDLERYTHIGVGVLGPPYIPITRRIVQSIFEETGKGVLLGGPGIKYLEPRQFAAIYGKSGVQITNDLDLTYALALQRQVPEVYDISVSEQVKGMSLEKLSAYLNNEFSLFVSQGCKYNCDFCVADKAVPETFSSAIKSDLDAVCEKATNFDIKGLRIYLSPLDAFQTPNKFKEVLEIFVAARKEYGIEFKLRVLSRLDSFLKAMAAFPELYELIPNAGLKIIGFGVDGTTEEEWKSQHKGNKSIAVADEAFGICKSIGVVPENLMVMGFHDDKGRPVGTRKTLEGDVIFSVDRAMNHGVVSRPHLAKDMVPGSKGWRSPVWEKSRNTLLGNPDLFVDLDFLMLGSEITHPNAGFKEMANAAFTRIIDKLGPYGLCTSNYLIPHTGDTEKDRAAVEYNSKVPVDR